VPLFDAYSFLPTEGFVPCHSFPGQYLSLHSHIPGALRRSPLLHSVANLGDIVFLKSPYVNALLSEATLCQSRSMNVSPPPSFLFCLEDRTSCPINHLLCSEASL
jgi:hypothetical protein